MSYIGKTPVVGNFQICDAISVVNGQAAYTMQVGSVNVSPESANNMIVSLNGVIQKPDSSYTISGSTITFASNLVSGDIINFIQILGDVLNIGTPSDGTITSGKLASNSVTTAKITDANVTTAKIADSNVTGAKTNFVSTSSAAGLQIKGDGTTDGTLQLNCSQNSHGIKFASPAHSSQQSYTLKFPTGNVTADKFLKVASVSGSGTSGIGQLSFADAGGGAWNLISTTTISNAATTIITGMDSTYSVYCFQIHDFKVSGNSEAITIRYQIGGAIKTDGKYDYVACRANAAPSDNLNTGGTGNDTAEIQLLYDGQAGYAAEQSFSSTMFIFNPSGTALRKLMRHSSVFYNGNGAIAQVDGCGSYNNSNGAVTGIQFYNSAGANIASGKIKLYGIS